MIQSLVITRDCLLPKYGIPLHKGSVFTFKSKDALDGIILYEVDFESYIKTYYSDWIQTINSYVLKISNTMIDKSIYIDEIKI